jgi:membrane protease YdiL (CAAX protease family)
MTIDVLGFVFLVYLFVLLPRAALRTARLLRAAADGAAVGARMRARVLAGTLLSLTVTFAMAYLNADSLGRDLFAVPRFGWRELAAGLGAFALLLGAIPVSHGIRSEEERRRMAILTWMPRTLRELPLFGAAALAAGIAEEAAYRGVAVWLLSPMVGGYWPAAFLSAAAFAVSHFVQGAKSMALVFAFAFVFHGLVWLTNTLVIAMVVHTAYDLVAGHLAGQRARRYAAEAAASAANAARAEPASESAGAA